MLRWLYNKDMLIEELREQNRILRQENKELYERMLTMAASVPHIRIPSGESEEREIEAESSLATFDDDGVRVGNKGANVV